MSGGTRPLHNFSELYMRTNFGSIHTVSVFFLLFISNCGRRLCYEYIYIKLHVDDGASFHKGVITGC